jgi:DNA-binding transcriptional LysR family regulator
MDRFEAMSLLVSAVDAGSLSAAARRLGLPLATVSRKVGQLESRLKTRLLNRSSRRLTLTDSGRAYVEACRRILDELHDAEQAAAGEYRVPRGQLVVSAPIVMGRLHVLPVAVEFIRAHPEVDLRLDLADRYVNLLEEQVDLAVRVGDLPDSGLIATRVGSIRLVTCASPAYFAAHGVPQAPRDLRAHDCITFEGLSPSDAWRFRHGAVDVTVPVRSRLAVSTAEAAIDAAAAGLGITRVLSYQIERALRAGLLAATLREFEHPPRPVSLVFPGGRRLPLKVRAFLDFAVPELKKALQ